LQVVKVDTKNNIICVKGSTPGARGAWLVVEDSIKQKVSQRFRYKNSSGFKEKEIDEY
jgi:ribosomal protein L3